MVDASATSVAVVAGGLARGIRKARARVRLERLRRRATGVPCLPLDPAFHVGTDNAAAREACEAAGWWRTCPEGIAAAAAERDAWRVAPCPRLRALAEVLSKASIAAANLKGAKVPAHEAGIILAAARGEAPLWKRPALLAVCEWLEARRHLLLMLAGPTGLQKTISACYALARRGGLYSRAYALWRPGFDADAAQAVELLVIDQLGRENMGASAFGLQLFEEIIDGRVSAGKATILCGNLERAQFDQRYEDVVADRFRGFGLWLDFDGDSLRVQP